MADKLMIRLAVKRILLINTDNNPPQLDFSLYFSSDVNVFGSLDRSIHFRVDFYDVTVKEMTQIACLCIELMVISASTNSKYNISTSVVWSRSLVMLSSVR